MALTIWRIGRSLRSICLPMTSVIAFSFLLTWIFVLYQPTDGPGLVQRMGWQSWDTVLIGLENVNQALPPQPGHGPGDDESAHVPHGGVDWWNVTQDTTTVDTTSLPLDVWSPLLPHDTGLTEIAVERCLVNPDRAPELCMPKTTKEDDALKGKWVRIPRNLNTQKGFWYLHVFYRRTRRQDAPLITDIQVLSGHFEGNEQAGWKKVATSVRDGVPGEKPLFLWYQTGKSMGEMSKEEKKNGYIMELDVLYGEDRPWYGFDRMDKPIDGEVEGKSESVWLSYRKGLKPVPKAPPLHFSHTGRFKILQIADLHFSVSFGACQDVESFDCKHSDNTTRTLISQVLAAEKPNLVVFTGDQLNGQGTSWDPRSVLAKFAVEVTDAGIPWAAVFGNHDEEDVGSLEKNGKEAQVKMMQGLPYSLVQRGPKDVHGVGNYVLKVLSPDPSKTHLLTLYFLDSGSYSKGIMDWFGFWRPTEYDYLHKDQINWFLQESARINPIERPFTPDGSKDFGDVWGREEERRQQVTPETTKLAKPNALMFFHIPLQEAYSPADKDSHNADLNVGISGLEKSGSANTNEGFFEKGVLQALESPHVEVGKKGVPEVKAIGNGHCHLTENCKRVKGVWMCFGGGGSYSGYGKVGFDRRFRIYDISDYGETVRTYKRTEKGDTVDDMFLAGSKAPPLRR